MAPPSWGDLMGLVEYVLSDPYLFIGRTTVMTSGLIAGTAVLSALALGAPVAPALGRPAERALAWLAPRLALILAYFGVGSMLLATQILIRFGDVIPYEAVTQFRSGVGHLALAALGIFLLRHRLRRLAARTWTEAHFWALAYFTVHVQVITPPWFEFQGQADLVLGATRALLAGMLVLNLALWWWLGGASLTSFPRRRHLLPRPTTRR